MAPEMTSSSLRRSARAARGRPQLATCVAKARKNEVQGENSHRRSRQLTGPQKCVPIREWSVWGKMARRIGRHVLKKYSRAAGERIHVKKVDAIVKMEGRKEEETGMLSGSRSGGRQCQ